MQCKICGRDNAPEARFCANCGAVLAITVKPPLSAAVPSPPPVAPEATVEYIGFWIRFGASIIDGAVISVASFVLSRLTWGLAAVSEIFLFWLYYWLFTGLKGQTLGKMAVGIKVVNAQGDMVGLGSAAMREILGKTLSTIALCFGFLWIAWDSEKQGWHDKIASTYVIKTVKESSQD